MGRIGMYRMFLVVGCLFVSLEAAAQVPSVLNFSGRLGTDAGDYSGAADIHVTLYDDPVATDGAHVLWTESFNAFVDTGRFYVVLGNSVDNPLPVDLLLVQELYVGVAIGEDAEMTPRMRVATVPYALYARNALTLAGNAADGFSLADHTHAWGEFTGTIGASQLPAEVATNDDLDAGVAGKVGKDQANSVTGAMIADGTIIGADVGENGCAVGQVISFDGTKWVCADDMVKTYSGTDFALSTQLCEGTDKVVGIDAAGQILCAADLDTTTEYLAGVGLELNGTTFSVTQSVVAGWAKAACYDTADELYVALDARYAPLVHNHNTLYHTKAEVDGVLAGKSAATHKHDDVYYPKGNVDSTLAGKAKTDHNHDNAYVNIGQTGAVTSDMIVDGEILPDHFAGTGCQENQVMKWDGAKWVCAADTGNIGTITSVAAGPGLTGGGNAGSVSLEIPDGAVTTQMLQTPEFFISAGYGLAGGGYLAPGDSVYIEADWHDHAPLIPGNGISGDIYTGGNWAFWTIGNLDQDWLQKGPYDIVLAHASSEFRIKESVGNSYYGTLDVGDLSSHQTYTFKEGGTVWHSGNDGTGSGLDADMIDGIHASQFATTNFAYKYMQGGWGWYTDSGNWYELNSNFRATINKKTNNSLIRLRYQDCVLVNSWSYWCGYELRIDNQQNSYCRNYKYTGSSYARYQSDTIELECIIPNIQAGQRTVSMWHRSQYCHWGHYPWQTDHRVIYIEEL